MIDWTKTLSLANIKVGDELSAIEIPVTLQRLVMEAGANYDLSLMHHDQHAAKAVGSPDAFANTFFLMGMFERLLREWAGQNMRINRIGDMRMQKFNVVDQVVTFNGKVREIENNRVTIDLSTSVDEDITCSAFAVISINQ